MIIEPNMRNSVSFDVRYTVNRNGVIIDLPNRRIHLKGWMLLKVLPMAVRLLCGK